MLNGGNSESQVPKARTYGRLTAAYRSTPEIIREITWEPHVFTDTATHGPQLAIHLR